MKAIFALGVAALALVLPSTASAWKLGQWDPGIHNVENAIYYEFCGHRYRYCWYGGEAWRVSACESGHRTTAINGQYVNLFQMGYRERLRYGWHTAGSSPWLAARAAFRYFRASGWSWHAWTCQP